MASRSNSKFWDQVIAEAESQGLVVDKTSKNSHYKVTRPGYDPIIFLPSTPSDYRGMKNGIGLLRRELGFTWKNR
jgi:hypothetical protein